MAEEIKRWIFRNPTLKDTRGGRHLFVWGEIGQWIIVDDELSSLMTLFDGKRDSQQVLIEFSKTRNKPLKNVIRESEKILAELIQRGVLVTTLKNDPIKAEQPRLSNLTLNLTNRCNLRCLWCYNRSRNTEEVPIDVLFDAVRKSRSLLEDEATLIILGGEPFIDPERLCRALYHGSELFSKPILISTNGTLFTNEIVNSLAGYPVDIQVSLDSHDPQKNDRIRGQGTFSKSVEGVKMLVDQGIHTVLCMVYTKSNTVDFEPYFEMALRLGVNEVRFIPLRLIGAGKHLDTLAPDQHASFRHLLDVLNRNPRYRDLLKRDFFTIVMNTCLYKANRSNCGIGSKTVFIDADGKVYPCPNHVLHDYFCGDIHTKSLTDIVIRSPVMERIRSAYHVNNYSECNRCAYRYWCSGDCRGEVLSLTGNPNGVSPHCNELKRLYTEMLWSIAEGSALSNRNSETGENYTYPFRF